MSPNRDYIVPELGTGPDHEHYDYRPLNAHSAGLRWPEEAPVALCVIVTLEHLEWRRLEGAYISPTLSGGYGNRPHPDVTRWSHREYGHRVGVSSAFSKSSNATGSRRPWLWTH